LTKSDEGAAMPIGIRFCCEECGEEAVVAVPATHARYGLVDCPACESVYLVLLSALEPAVAPATVAS
jgi:transcription elongation factor Elf1